MTTNLRIPTLEQAEELLREGARMNPGAWIDHSRCAATNARLIAARCAHLDADAAYIMGLLHDIGRREGVTYMRHILDGHRFMLSFGWTDAAAICLTHSFPATDINDYLGEIDISDADRAFVDKFITTRDYTDYDRLIQLCDAISMPEGAVLIEKRLMDVGFRYGFPKDSSNKWRRVFELKRHFDALAGENIYWLLPNIVENTFSTC